MKLPPGHLPQLDSLRTFAVGLVIVYHWFPQGQGVNRLPLGSIGVVIFFVISGFLITRILLNSRNQIIAGRTTPGQSYRNFFIRRALRIFPLYYLVISLTWWRIPQATDIDQFPAYYYLYGYNILLHQTGNWADVLSPFWTLGVEEQLYLIWPWVVLLTPPTRFRWALAALVGGAVLFRAWSYSRGDTEGLLMPANLDTFGLGAVWAYVVTERADAITGFTRRINVVAVLALLAFVGLLLLPADDLFGVLFMRLVLATLALFLVVHGSVGFGGLVGIVLNNSVLQYIGRISYGIYVFHMLVPGHIMPWLLQRAGRLVRLPDLTGAPYQLLCLAMLIALASASWYGFEKPINDLKQRFR